MVRSREEADDYKFKKMISSVLTVRTGSWSEGLASEVL